MSTTQRWARSDVARVHLGLLADIRRAKHCATSLSDLIDLLSWVEGEDNQPFSFAACIAAARELGHLWSDDRFEGLDGLDCQEVRKTVAGALRARLAQALRNAPPWVERALRERGSEILRRIDGRDPQWLDDRIRDWRLLQREAKRPSAPLWLRLFAADSRFERDPLALNLEFAVEKLHAGLHPPKEGSMAQRAAPQLALAL